VKAVFRILFACCIVAGAVTSAAARTSDIGAILKRFDALYAKGDCAGALVEGQKFEAAGRMRVAANHSNYGVALVRQAVALDSQGKYAQAAELDQRALAKNTRRPWRIRQYREDLRLNQLSTVVLLRLARQDHARMWNDKRAKLE
jgi:tetratricopeptide (TPR) repeat protein